ncbi:sulfur carrier protein ThiS adenylyltransferase ThiF [uncultured Pseudodesulfovibrio sp.]|uniref:sulfur carrier protein ThiS adenylyltransferase ThiF n=1 Tax=uncultured Pseudodesulfovibrio sp. TaxID=2035858 RepID=UPI0029C6EA4E|nr:sulfur carrier protein ThiS adenylyltransferase ThiF [uncultured Pseudodesulfovibrio sp.]
MNEMERGVAVYVGEKALAHLQSVTVGIAGAGGLGSNCAMNLVRCGFRKFVLADFDRVEKSNLNRQAFTLDQVGKLKVVALAGNMKSVNPDLEIELVSTDLNPENMDAVFMNCDAVVEALDVSVFKRAVVEAYLPSGKLVVAASGIGGTGDADAIVTRRVRDNFYMIGDMETECCAEYPPFSPKVTVAAAKQADVVFSHFLDEFKNREGA